MATARRSGTSDPATIGSERFAIESTGRLTASEGGAGRKRERRRGMMASIAPPAALDAFDGGGFEV
jgi:hypothetical protein